MSLFEFWEQLDKSENYIHPDDQLVLNELNESHDVDFNFDFPPGHYFGPLKTAKIVLCYANPGIDTPSLSAIKDADNRKLLLKQLSGEEHYPYKIPGWFEWFSKVANSLFLGDIELASSTIAVANLLPYASVNMDKSEVIANCLPSAWAMQNHLRENLIPRAKHGEILLIMCRSSHLWGLRTSLNAENIIINNTRTGFTKKTKSKVSHFIEKIKN
ncbi:MULTISPECIES: hypothetical protein [Aeromonas]|uniref:hypothetical protein n=1 Tax=Aeromonas TaxID=642 RepID=UPI001F46B13F|nr:hypothetical protein [Aeromonas rivipollensis]MCE9945011.1 hypothetical protein [Aeromonas rivipollensis]